MIVALTRLQARELADSSRPLSGEDAEAVLREAGARIDIVGRLYRLLSESPAKGPVDLGAYLSEAALSVIVATSSPGAKPRFSAELRECALNRHQALQAGLIVGELVMNSVKYAHPAGVAGEIRLTCRPAGPWTLVEIADDGVGFPEGFDPEHDGGLGLRLVRSLAAQLNAGLAFDQTDLGLSVRLEIRTNRSIQH
jgi:two-component sensor histidine kinase